MTRAEVEITFERDLESMDETEFLGVTNLANEEGFAKEAGEEFVTAVAVVGLHRVLTTH
jgi:hypothetical protein